MPVAERATLSLNDLVLINELNPRERLNEETIIRYMECFESLPPVRVQRGTNVVVDGFQRVKPGDKVDPQPADAKGGDKGGEKGAGKGAEKGTEKGADKSSAAGDKPGTAPATAR